MSAGKGDRPRPVNGEKFRANHERIFGRRDDESPVIGEVVDGAEFMGGGCWHVLDQIEKPVRDGE